MKSDPEFTKDCTQLVARTALDAAEKLSTDQRLMIHRGIMELFPENSSEWQYAKTATDSLATYKNNQLQLFKSLNP